jgi:hypothetical protein
VKVIVHDVQPSLRSLLADSDLMQKENLIVKTSPLENTNIDESGIINEINDGECYKTAYS